MKKGAMPNTHQKRYGQYFSGEKVANLLFSLLPANALIESAVDPMAGVGDLLRPVLSKTQNVLAVEIDAAVAKQCASNLPSSRVVNKDAFMCSDIITPDGWDLVITNPPYVRYQLQDGADGKIGTSNAIRKNLCKAIDQLQHLSSEDKAFFLRLAQSYSGLSDMAVPSWILCASLVKMNGLLAIVVPETWLNREYAAPVQYLLTKCFDILTIVKDVNACWFENALVKTCLVIARRHSTLSLSDVRGNTFCVDIESKIDGDTSLIDGMKYNGKCGVAALTELLETMPDIDGEGFRSTLKKTLDLFPHMLNSAGTSKWVLAGESSSLDMRASHPIDILPLLHDSGYSGEYITLSDFRVECGQGLRTGANDFFYLNIKKEKSDSYIVNSNLLRNSLNEMVFPLRNVVKTVRNRKQVDGLVASYDKLTTGLLLIHDEVRVEDLPDCENPEKFAVMDTEVSKYITSAEQYRNPRGLALKDYSAVSPNERRVADKYLRFWYMLPSLTARHLPSLCMTRINSVQPECIFVLQDEKFPIVVDANFVTIWSDKPQSIKVAFVLLNSTWARCYLESLCTVMGGGALKLEAAQLKKLKFPKYTRSELMVLEELGDILIQRGTADIALQNRIDQAVLAPFRTSREIKQKLCCLLEKKLAERGAKKDGL